MRLGAVHLRFLPLHDLSVFPCEHYAVAFLTGDGTALHVLDMLDGLDDRGIGGRTSDTQFFHVLDQGSLVVSERRFGIGLNSLSTLQSESLALRHGR